MFTSCNKDEEEPYNQEYISNHQVSNEDTIEYPFYKGLGIGSNAAHVLEVLGEYESMEEVFLSGELRVECWIYDEVEVQFEEARVNSINIRGDSMSELDFVVEESVVGTINNCSATFEKYTHPSDTEPYFGYYEFGGENVLVLAIEGVSFLEKDINISDKSEFQLIQLLGSTRIYRGE